MIEEFQGEYRWLSNFWEFDKPFEYQGLTYPTNEHFYVAMKTTDTWVRGEVANHPLKGLKSFGRTIELRPDWEQVRLPAMKHGLMYKFSHNNPTLRKSLIATGDKYIQEGNKWHDNFFGVCSCTKCKSAGIVGENNLGKLIMSIREKIIKEES